MKLRVLSEPIQLLYALAHGIYYTILPQILLHKSCLEKFNNTLCDSNHSKLTTSQKSNLFSEATVRNMTIAITNIVISIIFILPFGGLSDIISKKKLMLIPSILRLSQSLVFILNIKLETLHIGILVMGGSMTGLYGDILGASSLAAAYMADGTPSGPERTARMIGLGACIYTGRSIGAFLSGIVANKYGFTYSFILSVSICLLNIVLVVFVLPAEPWRHSDEGLHEGDQEQPQVSCLLYAMEAAKQSFIAIDQFARNYCFTFRGTQIWLLTLSFFFGILCLYAEFFIIALFLMHDPLNFSSIVIGPCTLLLMTIRGVGGFLLVLLVNTIKLTDRYAVTVGFFSFIGTYIAMVLSATKAMLLALSLLASAYPLTISVLQSCLTKRVKVSEHGTVLSFACFVSLIGFIPMTLSINSLFKYTAEIFPGICMLMLAGCSALGLILAMVAVAFDRCSNSYTLHKESLSSDKNCAKNEGDSDSGERHSLVASNGLSKSYGIEKAPTSFV